MPNPQFFDCEGNPMDAPEARSMDVIKRESERDARARCRSNSMPGRDHAAARAFQYMMAIRGHETGHSISLDCDPSKLVTFDYEPRKIRPRMVMIDGCYHEIPNWNWEPGEAVETTARPAFRAPLRFYASTALHAA